MCAEISIISSSATKKTSSRNTFSQSDLYRLLNKAYWYKPSNYAGFSRTSRCSSKKTEAGKEWAAAALHRGKH